MEFSQIATIAGKEFWDRIRNRWVLAVALVFTVCCAVDRLLRLGATGRRGLPFDRGHHRQPGQPGHLPDSLIALVLGFDAIVGERERGSLDLLLSMPITRLELLLGKFFGLRRAHLFHRRRLRPRRRGAGGAARMRSLFHYFGFMLSSVLLGCAFLSIAVMCGRRRRPYLRLRPRRSPPGSSSC